MGIVHGVRDASGAHAAHVPDAVEEAARLKHHGEPTGAPIGGDRKKGSVLRAGQPQDAKDDEDDSDHDFEGVEDGLQGGWDLEAGPEEEQAHEEKPDS